MIVSSTSIARFLNMFLKGYPFCFQNYEIRKFNPTCICDEGAGLVAVPTAYENSPESFSPPVSMNLADINPNFK